MTTLQWLGVAIIAATFFGLVASIDGWKIALTVVVLSSLFFIGGYLVVFGA